MKLELKPHIDSVAKRVGPVSTNAGISKDGQVRWVYENAYLEVIRPRTNGILASWRFGKELQDTQTAITAVTDIKTQSGLLLLVATSNISDCGTLHVFSVKLRKVVRVIEFPQRISALEVVFANETEDVSPWIISKHLQFFSGLVAVGTEGCYVYLIDLCLDDLDMSFASEATPKKLMVISPRMVDPIAKREEAHSYDKHLALLLDDQCHRQEQFFYRRQDDTVQKVFEEDAVWISSLTYIAQAGTLAIGFNFGCFQLWRLYNPVLDYSSRFSADSQAVSHFLVQEPENDPRSFVYIWVVHDNAEEETISNVCLYQLAFAKKDAYANFGVFYDELESVCPRLEHHLTVDPYNMDARGTSRSTVVSCYTLKNPLYSPPAVLSESFEEGFHGNDLSLSIFVWRADSKQGGRGSTTSNYWMSVFDINRWYHAQMPHSLRCHGASVQVCSYWAVYDLEEVVAQLPSQVLLNVEVSGKKVLRFTNNTPVPPEEHSYPSALQFSDVYIVLAEGAVQVQCRGWQGQLFREMILNGAQYLVQPADFYHQCLRARLLPQSFEESKTRSADYQRKALLNMALERGLAPALIPQCISLWEEEGLAEQGCSLTFLLNWVWESVITTKNSFVTACAMLYDWCGLHLDPRTDRQIAQHTQTLCHIRQIFTFFMVQAPPTTERGQFELELRQQALSILLEHCEVVRWSISSALLPEIDDVSEPSEGLFTFPASELDQAYKNRRAELRAMKGTIDGMSLLLVDALVECQGPHIRQVWENCGGDGTYPPPSMQALMNMYLIEEVSVEVKNAILLYFLQDLAMLDRSAQREASVASFIQRFMLNPSLVHQVQGLWFIDHRDFEEGVRHLVHANVHNNLCDSWRHAAVVNTLLAQGQGRMATFYMHTKPVLGGSLQERQLRVSVLMHNRQVSQALEVLRGFCEDEKTRERLMGHLLRECQFYKLLGQLLQQNLVEWEENALEAHLRARPEPHALDPLLLYYLQRSRFLQAFRLNQDINLRDKLEMSLASQERSITRNKLMEAYLKVLPEVTRKMLTDKQTIHAVATSAQRIQLDPPRPLSTVVRQGDFAGMSRARFIMAVIDKINEATTMLIEDEDEEQQYEPHATQKDGFDVPFLSTPRTPKRSSVKRMSEGAYTGTELSPLVTKSVSFSAKKTLSILRTAETQEEKNSLKKLASECLEVLQTPVREHKKTSASPGLAMQVPAVKTPQSILKVRRLSKTLPSSREKLSSRRNSGSRPMRLSMSKSDTSHNASPSFPSSTEKQAVSPSTLAGATEKPTTTTPSTAPAVTPKQLRFIGISPSPTPSPSVISFNVSAESEKSAEVVQSKVAVPAPPVAADPAPYNESSVSKVLEVTGVQWETNLPKGKEPDEKKVEEAGEVPMELTVDIRSHTEEFPSFEEGPEDRYSDQFEKLVRPDLQSPWKQNSPELTVKDTEGNVQPGVEESSKTASPVLVAAGQREDRSVIVQNRWIEKQVTLTQISERVNLSFSQEVSISSTNKEIGVKTSQAKEVESKSLTEDSVVFPKPISPVPGLRKSSSVSPRSSVKVTSQSLLPIRVETSPLSGKTDESPPATPPSSKRAKMMATKADDTAGLVRIRLDAKSSPTPEREVRRRKTPERRVAPASHDTEELHTSVSSVLETTETQERRKTQERSVASLAGDTAHHHLTTSASSVSEKAETEKRRTPERRSPARHPKSTQESARKTSERRSPGRKVRKLSEENLLAEGEEESNSDRDSSPARKVAKVWEIKSILASKEVLEGEEKGGEGTVVESFTSAEKVFEHLEESEMSPDGSIPARRRSARLNTPDRTVSEPAGRKSSQRTSQRGTTPSKQDVESNLSVEFGTRRSLRRLNTPERSVVEAADTGQSTPTRRGRQGENPVHRRDAEDESSAKEEEKGTPSRRSSRKNQPVQRLSKVREVVEAEEDPVPAELQHLGQQGKKSSASNEAAVEENSEQVHNLRHPRRQTKTPERLTADTSTEHTQLRKSRRQSKTPDRLVEEKNTESSLLRKSRCLSKTPDRLITEASRVSAVREVGRVSKTPDRLNAKSLSEQEHDMEDTDAGRSDHVDLRRSRRQSKTPDRQAVPEVAEPLTPTRRSRRQHKTPDVLNTDEIEPLSSTTSPKRAVKEALPEPATPPKMSARKEKAADTATPSMGVNQQPPKSGSSPVKTAPAPAAGRNDTKLPLTPTRRSARKARSPERLNTDLLQPISPHSSPTRSKSDQRSGGTDVHTEKQSIKSQKETTSESDTVAQKTLPASVEKSQASAADETAPVASSFVFSPPLKHSLRSQDTEPAEGGLQHEQQQHHFVFSSPSVASQPEAAAAEEKHQQQAKSKRSKKLHKLYTEDEVQLLSPLPTPARSRGAGSRPRRQLSQTQIAAAHFLKRLKQTPPKSRRLIPRTKSSRKN